MADALEQLKERLAEVTDLGKVARLLAWDQQTMMPPAGTAHRADQFSTLLRISHERFTDSEVGRLLEELRELFGELKPPLVQLIAELRERDVDTSFLQGDFPPERQRALAYEVTDLFGHRPDSWRIDPTEHPFASGPGRDDVRITTNYHPDSLESLFSTMHEYGHGLYSHQQPKHLERLPTGGPCSLGIHESQSRRWENLVGPSRPFWQLLYPRLPQTYPEPPRA